jgi:hypothetical protein
MAINRLQWDGLLNDLKEWGLDFVRERGYNARPHKNRIADRVKGKPQEIAGPKVEV